MEVSFINRNVTIVVIILILVVLAGYLVWFRSKVAPSPQPLGERPNPTVTPTLIPSPTVSPTATPSATPKVGQKVATSSAE